MRLVFLDTETTGLEPYHEIWEVGAIVRDEDFHDEEFVWQLPVNTALADDKALEINHYWDRRLPASEIYSLHQFAAAFHSLTTDAILVVNNVYFDVPRLEKILYVWGHKPQWHYHPRDVQDLAVGFLMGFQHQSPTAVPLPPPPWSGHQVLQIFGLPPGDHTALGDARTVRDLWDLVVGTSRCCTTTTT